MDFPSFERELPAWFFEHSHYMPNGDEMSEPTPRLPDWAKNWKAVLVALATVFVGTVVLALLFAAELGEEEVKIRTVIKVVLVIVIVILAHFIHVFTRDLSVTNGVSTKLRTIFIYAYGFQFAAIAFSLLPFFSNFSNTGESVVASDNSWAGVAFGCVRTTSGEGGLTRCSDDGYADQQWLLHIGSRRLNPDPITLPKNLRAELSGGLVVPLYVLVLALMGATVGMTRRLPEIQRRAASSYHGEWESLGEKKGVPLPIKPIRAREEVVFQIMQVFAAPLIAVTAYTVIGPDSVVAAALIGFSSGFASEAILKIIRSASEAIARRDSSKSGG